MAPLESVSKLPTALSDLVGPFCDEVRALLPQEVRTIILYGSAASGEYVKGRSNLNVLLLLEEARPARLKRLLKLVDGWERKGFVAPLILTPQELAASTDSFPLELLDMKERHVLLFGEDPFDRLSFKTEDLRLACERELRGKLIRLRQAYLEWGLKGDALRRLLLSAAVSLIPVLRGLLYRKGISADGSEEILRKSASEFGLDGACLNRVWLAKRGEAALSFCDTEEHLLKLIGTLEVLIRSIEGGA